MNPYTHAQFVKTVQSLINSKNITMTTLAKETGIKFGEIAAAMAGEISFTARMAAAFAHYFQRDFSGIFAAYAYNRYLQELSYARSAERKPKVANNDELRMIVSSFIRQFPEANKSDILTQLIALGVPKDMASSEINRATLSQLTGEYA